MSFFFLQDYQHWLLCGLPRPRARDPRLSRLPGLRLFEARGQTRGRKEEFDYPDGLKGRNLPAAALLPVSRVSASLSGLIFYVIYIGVSRGPY